RRSQSIGWNADDQSRHAPSGSTDRSQYHPSGECSMKRISILVFVAAGFMFIAAPIYMSEMSHQVFVSGNLLGHAQMVNGVWAIPLDEFAKAIGGNGGTSLQQAGLTIN